MGPVYVIVFDMLIVATACLAGYVWAKMVKGVGMRLMPYSVADTLQCLQGGSTNRIGSSKQRSFPDRTSK